MKNMDRELDVFIDEYSYIFDSLNQKSAFFEFIVQFGLMNLGVNLSIN